MTTEAGTLSGAIAVYQAQARDHVARLLTKADEFDAADGGTVFRDRAIDYLARRAQDPSILPACRAIYADASAEAGAGR